MAIRQITQISNHDDRIKVYTTFEDKKIYFSFGGTNKVVITPDEASRFANWLLDQKKEIERRA
jgi:hypothetical protein